MTLLAAWVLTAPRHLMTCDAMPATGAPRASSTNFWPAVLCQHIEQSGVKAGVHCRALQTPLLKPLMSVKQDTQGAAALPPSCLQQLRSIRSEQVGPCVVTEPSKRDAQHMFGPLHLSAHITQRAWFVAADPTPDRSLPDC